MKSEETGESIRRRRSGGCLNLLTRGSRMSIQSCQKLDPTRRGSIWLAAIALVCGAASALGADQPALPPITSVSGSPRLPGKFVWADLVTDDVLAAQKFYAALGYETIGVVREFLVKGHDEILMRKTIGPLR